MQELEEEQIPSQFRIKESAHAIKVLSKTLYSRPIEAIVRELVCNALDAHKEAGTEHRAFDINIESVKKHTFRIRDYGPGLPQSSIFELYTTYFQSTKQKGDKYIGSFGLGSKSPFAYTDNFYVVSRYYGVRSTYHAYINSTTLLPEIKLISTELQIEDQGLEIYFDVKYKDYDEFHIAFRDVLENLKENQYKCESFYIDHKRVVDNDHYFIKVRGLTTTKILCNNVQYRLDHYQIPEFPAYFKDKGVVFKIPDSEACNISVAPSREELHYDELTIKIVKNIVEASKFYFTNLMYSEINKYSIFELRSGQYEEIRKKNILFPTNTKITRDGKEYIVCSSPYDRYNISQYVLNISISHRYKTKVHESTIDSISHDSLAVNDSHKYVYGDLSDEAENRDLVNKHVKKTRQSALYFTNLNTWNDFVKEFDLPVDKFIAVPASSLKKATKIIAQQLKKEEVYTLYDDKWIATSVKGVTGIKYYLRLNHKTPFLFENEVDVNLKGILPQNTFGVVSSRLPLVENLDDWQNVEDVLLQDYLSILINLSHIKTVGQEGIISRYKVFTGIPGETIINNVVAMNKESLLTSEETNLLYKYNKLIRIIPESYGRLNITCIDNSNVEETIIQAYPMLRYCKYSMNDDIHIPVIKQYIQQCVEAKLNGTSNTGIQSESDSSNDQQEQTE